MLPAFAVFVLLILNLSFFCVDFPQNSMLEHIVLFRFKPDAPVEAMTKVHIFGDTFLSCDSRQLRARDCINF
jgi:hypothetical protein